MKTSDKGIALIKQFEGLRLDAYICPAGVPTIGYGTTRNVKMGQSITEADADRMLCEDLTTFEACVTNSVDAPLTQEQFDALVCFVYNLGCGAFKGSTLLKKINAQDPGAADEFLRWNKAGGRVLPGLTRRREAERALFLS